MASTYTDIGTELMTTGENAGNWGTKTNTNIQILEEAVRGYVAQSIAGGVQTTSLSYTDGSTGDTARNAVIALTGTITGNQTIHVTAKEKLWVIDNQTSGAYTVSILVSGQTGVTWAATDKGTKILYCNGTDVIDTGITSAGAFDLDGNELILDADADTSITADTDDQIDFRIAGADDFTMTANAFNVLTGSHATFVDSANAKFGTGNDMLVYHDGTNSYITNSQGALKVATETSGIAVTIGHTTSETTIADNLTVTGTLTGTLATAAQGSVTSLGTLTALTVDDVAVDGKVVTMTGSASDTAVFTAGTNGTLSIVTTDAAAAAANIQITADGTVDIDSAGVLTLDSGAAINIEPAAGSAILLDGTISVDAGVVTGATSITSTAFAGALTGNVTGNASGTAATVTTAAQSNITSLGTLTALTVDNMVHNGDAITMTPSTSDTVTMTAATNGAFSLVTVDAAAASANIQITADGTFEVDATTITLDSAGDINLEAAADVNIPANIGLTFGDDGEKIEGDGTNLTIASSANLILDSGAVLVLDGDNGIYFKDGGATYLTSEIASGAARFKSIISNYDMTFAGNDGGSTITALSLDMSNAGAATFNAAANVTQRAITSSSNAVAWDAIEKPNAVHITTENTTFSAPSNPVEGAFICVEINYNGSHTIAFNTVFEFAASTAPTFTSTDAKTDIMVFRYSGAVWQEVGRTLNLSEA